MTGREHDAGGKPKAVEDEGFLSRWSRRKANAKTVEDDIQADPPETASGEIASEVDQGEADTFDPATLPDIDSLGPGSDFSVFMQAGVPPSLKTKALRRLWQVKPELANLDGLIDYGEDLTGSFKVVDQLKTAYEVGRGFLKDADEALAGNEEDGTDAVDGNETADLKPLERSEPADPQAASEGTKGETSIATSDDPKDKA